MDPRPPSHPFSRPQSQQQTRDPRFTSIPPPPFGSQPSTPRSDTLHKNDPFLRRRNDIDEQRSSPSFLNAPRSFGLPQTQQYSNSSISAPQDAAANSDHLRRSSFGAGSLYGDRRVDGYASHTTEDTRDRSSLQHSLPSAPNSVGPGSYSQAQSAHEDPHRRLGAHAASPTALSVSTDRHLSSGRQMLPPSPHAAQAQNPPQAVSSRASLTSFSNGRDLPVPPSAQRPPSSMSISSMLGSDPAKPARETAPSSQATSSSQTLTNLLTSPVRQGDHKMSSPRLNYGSPLFNESSTSPGKYKVSSTSTSRPFRSFSGGPPFLGQPPSPGTGRKAPHSEAQAPQYSPISSSNSYRGRRPPGPRDSQRPSSQPSSQQTPRDLIEILSGHTDPTGHHRDTRKQYVEAEHANGEGSSRPIPIDHADSNQLQYEARPAIERRRMQSQGETKPEQEHINGLSRSYLSRPSSNSDPTDRRIGEILQSEAKQPFEHQSQSHNPTQLPFSPESLRRLQKERQGLHQRNAAQSPSKPGRGPGFPEGRQNRDSPGNLESFATHQDNSREIDGNDQQQLKDDFTSHRKSSLAMLVENSRSRGRFSPLPQAVQGAQRRTSGPASDPGIKNEFARMFSGIGSGVGSAGPNGSGASTPFAPPSPTMSHEQHRPSFHHRAELAPTKPATTSRGVKRSRKARDEESKIVVEDVDAATTNSKAIKRSRTNHHYHPYPHVHLHRHHHADDDRNNGSTTPTVVNGKRMHTPAQGPSVGPHRHHNHHHVAHHHHHHTPKPPRIPNTIINNEALLNSIRHLPRVHLGSIVYSSSLEPATSVASQSSKLGYTSTPNPLPRYEGKENCTFTVRVSRFYLSAQEREDICRRRALWGTDVYTDDSDPIAAAVHSGWIRGEFGEDVDPAMLELPSHDKTEDIVPRHASDGQDVFTAPPTEPMLPPPNKDLHLGLLILPPLETYTSRIAHGIKSRSWGKTHDGMSFRIEKMEWVDDQGNDRTGEAQRQRMKLAQAQHSLAEGPAIRPFKASPSTKGGALAKPTTVAVEA